MFGVTTPCVQQIAAALAADWECLVFHATGTGGRSMEKLIDSGAISAVIDVTTTEVADMLMGGVLPADEDRFGAIIRTRTPYIGSVGALDMVNFGPPDTVPAAYKGRLLHAHNPQVTLMRTTEAENDADRPLDRREAEPAWMGRCASSCPSSAFRRSISPARRSTTPRPTPRCSPRSSGRCARPPVGS